MDRIFNQDQKKDGTMKNTKYDVIIVNYNGEKILEDCLSSIYRCSLRPERIIINDNASSDNSIKIIRAKFPQVILIEGKKNIGFGRANNEAMKRSKADFILFMNNDLILDDKCPQELLRGFTSTSLAIISPIVYKGWNKKRQQDVYAFGAAINQSGFAYGLFDDSPDRSNLVCFSGACFMARSELIKQEGFEPSFFLYYEEPDLSLKLLIRGFQIARVSSAKCYHLESYSSAGANVAQSIAFRQFYGTQNRWFTVGKYWPISLIPKAIFYNEFHLFFLLTYFLKHRTFSYLKLFYLAPFSLARGIAERKRVHKKNFEWIKLLDKMSLRDYFRLGKRVFDEKRYKLFKSN